MIEDWLLAGLDDGSIAVFSLITSRLTFGASDRASWVLAISLGLKVTVGTVLLTPNIR